MPIIPDGSKFTQDGQLVMVLEQLQSGFLVAYGYFTGNQEEHIVFDEKNPRIVQELFDKPPTKVIDDRILQRQTRLDELNAKLREVESQFKGYTQMKKEFETLAGSMKAMENFMDFAQGRITHYVVVPEYEHYVPYILPFGQTQLSANGYDIVRNTTSGYYRPLPTLDSVKLLSLFGNSKGDLSWRLNDYKDGSGNWSKVVPCTSEEEAKRVLGELIATALRRPIGQSTDIFINEAKKHGIPVPKSLEEQRLKAAIDREQRELEKCEKINEASRSKIQTLTDQLSNLQSTDVWPHDI